MTQHHHSCNKALLYVPIPIPGWFSLEAFMKHGRATDAKLISFAPVNSLSHVANTIIGDESKRGVSGGQRKRVNIGIELAAVPLGIFLDEPTTGLDSTPRVRLGVKLTFSLIEREELALHRQNSCSLYLKAHIFVVCPHT
jgi:ABC-type cobalamin/Fe3+-siderophores transport system ATPase subunit